MTIYEKIDFLCESNNITRKNLAKQTGVSYATLNSMFARQSTNISLETIRALANHFNVSLDYLLADEIDHFVQEGELTQEKSEILKRIQKMSDGEVHAVLAFVNTLERMNREKGE